MSVELDPIGATYIYKTDDGLNGQSAEELERLREEYDRTGEQVQGIGDLLDRVISGGPDTVRELTREGKYLLGATATYQRDGDGVLGLLYGEAEGLQDDGSFSMVGMGTWVHIGRAAQLKRTREQVRDKLISYSFSDVADRSSPWGIPVNRATQIVDLQNGDASTFGYMSDMEVIRGIENDLPIGVFEAVKAAIGAFHRR
jgi:hypothetical protein